MPDHVRMLSREGSITGRVLDAGYGTGEHVSGWWRAGLAVSATIEITSEPGRIHAWLACATRN
jgi:hypothetical protein